MRKRAIFVDSSKSSVRYSKPQYIVVAAVRIDNSSSRFNFSIKKGRKLDYK